MTILHFITLNIYFDINKYKCIIDRKYIILTNSLTLVTNTPLSIRIQRDHVEVVQLSPQLDPWKSPKLDHRMLPRLETLKDL